MHGSLQIDAVGADHADLDQIADHQPRRIELRHTIHLRALVLGPADSDLATGLDLVFAENGQYDELWPGEHMQPVQTVSAVRDVRGATFVPVHWGMFDLALHHWSEPVRRSSLEADRWGLPMLTPLIGQVTALDSSTGRWWQDLDARDTRLAAPVIALPHHLAPIGYRGQIAALEVS